jgi:hypothetical protein
MTKDNLNRPLVIVLVLGMMLAFMLIGSHIVAQGIATRP